jgi:hypothetical protein
VLERPTKIPVWSNIEGVEVIVRNDYGFSYDGKEKLGTYFQARTRVENSMYK